MNVSVVVGDTTVTKEIGKIKVASLVLGTHTTSPDQTGATRYVMENLIESNTYCTSVNANLSASATLDYNSLFTFENRKIKSVAKGTYCNGTGDRNNTNISFNTNGTTYSFSVWEQYNQITSGGRYIRQANSTEVRIDSTADGDNNWFIYPVTYDVPTE